MFLKDNIKKDVENDKKEYIEEINSNEDIIIVNKSEEESFNEISDDLERDTGNTRYDRQIRLFGFHVQKHLSKICIQIIGAGSIIVAEILKNLVLLGVNNIFIEEKALEDFNNLVPNKITEINEKLKLSFTNDVINSNFLFTVDRKIKNKNGFYFICSKCYLIKKNKWEHKCIENEEKGIVLDCLLGAIVVQEFLKIIENKSHVEEYKIEI